MPKTSLIRPSRSTELRYVTDTDIGSQLVTALAYRRRASTNNT